MTLASGDVWYMPAARDELPAGVWERLLDFAVRLHKSLGLRGVYGIRFYRANWLSARSAAEAGVDSGWFLAGDDAVYVRVGADRSEAEMAETLAHELRHARQYEQGQPLTNALTPDIYYQFHPSEVDARRYAAQAARPYALERNVMGAFEAAVAEEEAGHRWERGAADIDAAFAVAEREEARR